MAMIVMTVTAAENLIMFLIGKIINNSGALFSCSG